MSRIKITLTASGWTQTISEIYWDTVEQALYADQYSTNEVFKIDPPTRECWKFNGFFENSSADLGDKYVDEDGTFTDALFDKLNTLSSNITIYINSTQKSWKVSISPNYGIEGSGTSAIYQEIDSRQFYETDLCEGEPITRVNIYKREGYIFNGCWENQWTQGRNFISYDGDLLEPLTSLILSSNMTVWASWISPITISISANSGVGGLSSFYFDKYHNVWYADNKLTQRVSRITTHRRECYNLLGYMATNEDTSVLRVSSDGTIDTSWIPSKNETIYARWLLVSYKVSIGKQSGTGGTDALYYSNGINNPAGWYADSLCATAVTTVTFPTRSGYAIKGVYSATLGGTQYITRAGVFTADFNTWGAGITANNTVYAQWISVYKITLDDAGGTGGTGQMWYSSLDDAFFDDDQVVVQRTSVTPPTRECYQFTGYFSAASGGTQYITAAGAFTQVIQDLSITSAKTFYAQWERVSYKLTINQNGGTGGTEVIYNNGANAHYFADDHLTTRITSIAIASRVGCMPLGCYATKSGGSKYINADGSISASVGISADTIIYTRWTARSYVISFSVGPTSSKVVTFGQAVGTLPTPTLDRYDFVGWYVGETKITATYVWNFDENKTAVAAWVPHISDYFGNVVDYFGMASESLIPIASDSGDNKQRVCVSNATWSGNTQSNAGKYETNVNAVSGVWRNPSVTYAVVRSHTFRATLGKAWRGSGSGTSQVSGFMLVGVEITTGVGNFPTITLTGTANEGADAINKFDLSVALVARSKAQNLMNAVSGGGKLQACVLRAECDAVVLAENMMPCASDVVHGKLTVEADTINIGMEGSPNASNGFASVGEPCRTGDTSYKSFHIVAEKEIS